MGSLKTSTLAKNYFQQGEKDTGVQLSIRWMALESLQDGIFSETDEVGRLIGNPLLYQFKVWYFVLTIVLY